MKVIRIIALLLLLSSLQPLFSQDGQDSAEEEEPEQSLEEQRSLTIQYGIDSQILELISQLKDEKNENYFDPLEELFTETSNTEIQTAVADFFDTLENDNLVEEAFERLAEYDNLNTKIVLQLTSYLEEYQNDSIAQLFFEMIDDPRVEVASAAIKAIGVSDEPEYTEQLLEMYSQREFRDELKPTLITALGELGDKAAFELLDEIVSDEDESKSLRWRACQALGKIGGEDAFDSISALLYDDDPVLRSYAVNALGYLDHKGSVDILIDALRDNMWRVRVQAAEALGRKQATKAFEILRYKAQHDPDLRNVRLAAVKAIGELDIGKGYDYLRDLYRDSTAPLGLRSKAIEILVEDNLSASIDVINEVLDEEWEKEKSNILDYTCKVLSTRKSPHLTNLYKRMLNHPSHINLLIYGLRGVRLNKIGSLRDEVQDLTAENVSRSVRSLADSVLSEL
ncbi:MAG: HEAT repeat domain-containing protein [Spirochaetia bacterium]